MYAVIALTALLVSADYDAVIDKLAADPKTANHARDTLSDAGTEAFPALLGRIDDKTVIDNGLFHGATIHKPTIGRVSFEIIQYQIESAWPKGFRAHYALSEQNVAAWLKKHDGLSVTQLRIRACADSIDSLSREIETRGVTEFRLKNLSFLRDRLGKILDDAKSLQ